MRTPSRARVRGEEDAMTSNGRGNGAEPAQQEQQGGALAVPASGLLPDLDRLSAEDRDRVLKVFLAGVGAAAAMQAQTDMANVNVREYYGQAPTDLRREFSTLPRPAQGGSRRRSEKP